MRVPLFAPARPYEPDAPRRLPAAGERESSYFLDRLRYELWDHGDGLPQQPFEANCMGAAVNVDVRRPDRGLVPGKHRKVEQHNPPCHQWMEGTRVTCACGIEVPAAVVVSSSRPQEREPLGLTAVAIRK